MAPTCPALVLILAHQVVVGVNCFLLKSPWGLPASPSVAWRKEGSRSQHKGASCFEASVPLLNDSSSSGGITTQSLSVKVSVPESPLKKASLDPGDNERNHAVTLSGDSGNIGETLVDRDCSWGDFEDWLIQDTYSRYVVGSGKHVLWRRMVREVPELMGRTPGEARERWLKLTSRLEGDSTPGSPKLEDFYLQPPVLEGWEEEVVDSVKTGSFCGRVFGQKGLADGAPVTTACVDVTGRRLEDQYIITQCGVVYELGEKKPVDIVSEAKEGFGGMLKVAPVTLLALSTAFYAATILSHHLQVEIFVV